MERIIYTLILTLLITGVLLLIKNRSNFPDIVIIPLISSLITKYVYGDWDVGYAFTTLDALYWLFIVGISYITVRLTKWYQIQN